MSSPLVVPGELLQGSGVAGTGVYEIEGKLFASLVGIQSVDSEGKIIVTPASESAYRSVVPTIGHTVIGTISKITSKYAAVEIKAIELSPKSICLPEPFRGTIRVQDILAEDERAQSNSENTASVITTQISLWFAPGDLIRAKVIGVGDASAGFLLSTGTEPRLGVVFAKCASSGEPLVPVAWNQMICSKTGVKESRKCARPETQQ